MSVNLSSACYCEFGEDSYTHITEGRPRARKRYFCDECRGLIDKGEEHIRHTGFGVGKPQNWRICLGCEEPFEWVRRNCGCWLYADLERHLWEDVMCGLRGDLPPGVATRVGRWLVLMKRRRSAAVRTLAAEREAGAGV